MRPPAVNSESGPEPQGGSRRKPARKLATHQPGAPSGYPGRSAWLLYIAFFASGVSGLIYQVVWVRALGNVFGNTIQSASLVVAVFMLGLGVGSYLVGRWADRRYARDPGSLLRAYGQAELAIALLGLAVSLTMPHLGPLGALLSSYTQGANGWFVPSLTSYLTRLGIGAVLLLPITVLMGGTLTLLIRHLVRHDVSMAPRRIAALYAVNTVGAALGAFLTDFTLVPAVGLLLTQMIAVGLNVVAGAVAFAIAAWSRAPEVGKESAARRRAERGSRFNAHVERASRPIVLLASLALGLTGFAALGMEILWVRHATILLGGFRAVFALLLTVVLAGMGLGAFAGGLLSRRTQRPATWLMLTQAAFVVSALSGVVLVDARPIEAAVTSLSGAVPRLTEIWFNVGPLALLAGIPSVLMGLSFPLANALVQQTDGTVASRAGGLYLANTAGAVCGSLVTGFVLLPLFGIQASAEVLAAASALAIVPLYLCSPSIAAGAASRYRHVAPLAGTLLIAGTAIAVYTTLPANFVIRRALGSAAETRHILAQREGLTEVITIADAGDGRLLLTNGHAMSSTARLSQRYMRALAHIPLLMMERPASALVIGFGVGNTTHAATLHPSVRVVDVADLSRGILEHASFFDTANHGVLADPRVRVFVNDGRQHLQMQVDGTYDLITLEPPPISYAGVAALYSKEFYELARARLAPRGYISQWLPTYQVPTETTLSMIRAFIDVFPQAVLLSGAQADLLLIGTTGPTIDLDPTRVAAALANRPAVQDDLTRMDLGTVREIAGTFIGSADRLRDATADTFPVTDDWPLMEHSVLSVLNPGEDVPAAIVDLSQLPDWCPRCFAGGAPVPAVAGLDLYVRLLELAYRATPADGLRLAQATNTTSPPRLIAGSAYLGAIVPEDAELYNTLGVERASRGDMGDAINAFRQALQLDPNSARSHWHLGAALAQTGARQEAIGHLQRSLDIDPTNRYARDDLDALTATPQKP
jgi:spermidine synthase